MSKTARFVGTCPVCNGRQKIRGGVLVHHGYQRPGDGYIVGDCFAVKMAPHESSPDTAKAYLEHLQRAAAAVEAQLVAVRNAEQLPYSYRVYEGMQKVTKITTLRKGDQGSYQPGYTLPSFESHQKSVIANLTRESALLKQEQVRLQGLIDTWTKQPLTTVEEETRRTSAEAKAQRDEKKAARDAQKAAKQKAKDEREAKAMAKLEALLARARAILDKADPKNLKAVRAAYLEVLRLKIPVTRESQFHRSLGRTELLRAAGLMRNETTPMTYEVEVLRVMATASL